MRIAPPYVAVNAGEGQFGVRRGPDGNRWRIYVLPARSTGGAVGGAAPSGYAVAVAPLRDIDMATATT